MATVHTGSIGSTAGISIPISDYISRAWDAPTLTETWTFRIGGAAGTIVATLTIVYDASDDIVSVTRT